MSPLLFLLMFGVGVSFILGAIRKSANRTEEAWTGASARLKLPYHKKKTLGGRRKLEGVYHGYRVKVNTFTKSHGNGNSNFTRYTLNMKSLGLGLELTQQHFLSGLSNAFTGGQDLTVGDEDFDKAVIVQSTSPEAMQRFLTSNRRLLIRKFLTGTRRARITDDELSYIHSGIVNDEAHLKAGLDTLVRLAHSLQDTGKPAPPYQAPLIAQPGEKPNVRRERPEEPRFGESMGKSAAETRAAAAFLSRDAIRQEIAPPTAPEPVAPAPPIESPAPVAPTAEVEAPSTAEVTPTASEPEAIADASPAPEFADYDSQAATSEPQAAANEPEPSAPELELSAAEADQTPSADPVENPSAEADPGATVDYTALRTELFESGMMSSESKDAFAATYAGQPIAWSGKLRRISRFSSDFVFEGSGAKAVIELEGIVDGSFTKGVQAVVHLPEAAADEFGSAYDVQVTFTGELHSCDGFLRDILVVAGSMQRAD